MHTRALTHVFLVFCVGILCRCGDVSKTKERDNADARLSIAAASDLKYAMDSLVKVFTISHPEFSIEVNYGSSGKFYQQITRDAPFDLYFSADQSYTEKLFASGRCASKPTIYAIGRIVIFSKVLNTRKGIDVLSTGSIRKIAIANPMHAPYGKRAVEALRYYHLYDALQSKLITGENIAQTAHYVSSGAAEIGIIAQSLAMAPALQQEGNYYLIPEASHTPLLQSFVILKRAERKALAFTFSEYLSSPQAKQVLKGFGFTIPE